MARRRPLRIAALLSGALAAFATPSSAQIASNNYGWSAWLGCWIAEQAPARELLCMVPDGEGVRMITVIDGVARNESRVIADDRSHAVEHDDCRGSERARWSSDRRRVFLNAELTCGESMRRVSSGLLAFLDDTHWLSVQAVTVDGQTATRSTRYTLAGPGSVPNSMRNLLRDDVMPSVARAEAAADVSESDVDEATRIIDAAAVEQWLHAADADYEVAGGSALEHLNRGGTVVVERPVYVDRPVYVTPVVRSCWDPFWGGFVVGVSRHVGIGVGYASCGHHYYTRYSPWGYDLYGWRAYRPLLYVNRYASYYHRRGPIIIRTGSSHNRDRDYNRNRDHRGDDRWRNRDNDDDRRDRDRGRVTRDGYTRDTASRDRSTRDEGRADSSRQRSSDRTSGEARSSDRTSSEGQRSQRSSQGRTAQARNR